MILPGFSPLFLSSNMVEAEQELRQHLGRSSRRTPVMEDKSEVSRMIQKMEDEQYTPVKKQGMTNTRRLRIAELAAFEAGVNDPMEPEFIKRHDECQRIANEGEETADLFM